MVLCMIHVNVSCLCSCSCAEVLLLPSWLLTPFVYRVVYRVVYWVHYRRARLSNQGKLHVIFIIPLRDLWIILFGVIVSIIINNKPFSYSLQWKREPQMYWNLHWSIAQCKAGIFIALAMEIPHFALSHPLQRLSGKTVTPPLLKQWRYHSFFLTKSFTSMA